MMQSMKYVGQEKYLRGRTALVREDPVLSMQGTHPQKVLAQFDECFLPPPGKTIDDFDGDARFFLGFGWELFYRKDFEDYDPEDKPPREPVYEQGGPIEQWASSWVSNQETLTAEEFKEWREHNQPEDFGYE